ncbi:MAG: 5'-nucleotidase C-terminal domain-containing protein [Deltaproteobacteria bacterium]|nr:5'-nucleotidase C-terminal domain-containing protein [Deltaproteobacteria bacterium]
MSHVSFADFEPFRLIFTGDLHSNFDPVPSDRSLGGFARVQSVLNHLKEEAREQQIPYLQLDAGDCSEGAIYFNLGAGVASFEMLNRLHYDAIVVGNHDWLTGPYVLDKVLSRVTPNFSFLSANLNYKHLPEDNALQKKIKRYEVFYKVGQKFLKAGQEGFIPDPAVDYFKVGVFGLSTNEALYGFFFDPVKLKNPLSEARNVVLQLRRVEKVDVVILLSHLLDRDDLDIAQHVDAIDVVIGGHSHHKVIPDQKDQAMVIERDTPDPRSNMAWLAKTGEFGRFVGVMDLVYAQDSMQWGSCRYDLLAVDEQYRKDSEIDAFIQEKRTELDKIYLQKFNQTESIFSDEIAESAIDLHKSPNTESYFGNLMVSAIYEKTKPLGVDFAFNNSEFFSHGLLKGKFHTVDLYNLLSLIYDPLRNVSWTVWTFEVDGMTLKKAIDMVFMMDRFFDVAGLELVVDPTHSPDKVMMAWIDGKPVEDHQIYKVAAPEGIAKILRQMQEELTGLSNFQDTEIEVWPLFRTYVQAHSPLQADDAAIRVSGRIRTLQPDLAILSEDIQTSQVATEDGTRVQFDIRVKNFGYEKLPTELLKGARTNPTTLLVYYDDTPENPVDDIDHLFSSPSAFFPKPYRDWMPRLEDFPSHLQQIAEVPVPSLMPNEETRVSVTWDMRAPFSKRYYPYLIYFYLPTSTALGLRAPALKTIPLEATLLEPVQEVNLFNNKAMTTVLLHH